MVDAAGVGGCGDCGGGCGDGRGRMGSSSEYGHAFLVCLDGVKDLLGDRQRRVSETWSVYRCLTLGKVPVGYGFFALKSTVGRCVNVHMVEITCEDATSCLTVCTFSVVLLPLFT
jgi:hypothetical protein